MGILRSTTKCSGMSYMYLNIFMGVQKMELILTSLIRKDLVIIA